MPPFDSLIGALPVASIIITLCVAIAGAIAYRGAFGKSAIEVQREVIDTLKEKVALLEKSLVDAQAETAHLRRLLTALQMTMKSRGLKIEINGDMISISEEQVPHTVHIHVDSGEVKSIEQIKDGP